jgi:hypothetical protein
MASGTAADLILTVKSDHDLGVINQAFINKISPGAKTPQY